MLLISTRRFTWGMKLHRPRPLCVSLLHSSLAIKACAATCWLAALVGAPASRLHHIQKHKAGVSREVLPGLSTAAGLCAFTRAPCDTGQRLVAPRFRRLGEFGRPGASRKTMADRCAERNSKLSKTLRAHGGRLNPTGSISLLRETQSAACHSLFRPLARRLPWRRTRRVAAPATRSPGSTPSTCTRSSITRTVSVPARLRSSACAAGPLHIWPCMDVT